MIKKAILLNVLFVILTISVKSQTNVFIEENFRSGYVINNFLSYDSFPKTNPLILNEFKIGHKTLGTKDWHKIYNYPEVAVSVFAANLGNKRQFGYLFGILPNINFDIKEYKNSNLQATFGWGFAYISKPYDSITNDHNILLGSKLNHLAFISLNYRYNITNTFILQFGGAYIHASNGHYQVPNAGMNFASISVGAKKYFSDNQVISYQNSTNYNKKANINLSFGIGIHEFAGTLQPVGTPKYFIYTGSAFLGKNYSKWGEFFIGFSGKYYQSFNNFIVNRQLYSKNILLKSSIITLFIGNEFKFGHFSIFTLGGINIYSPFIKDFVYKNTIQYSINNILELHLSSKLGMKYYLLNPQTSKFNIFVAMAIKANFGNADFTELSTGIVF